MNSNLGAFEGSPFQILVFCQLKEITLFVVSHEDASGSTGKVIGMCHRGINLESVFQVVIGQAQEFSSEFENIRTRVNFKYCWKT